MTTLAQRLGTIEHRSLLLHKAGRLGLATATHLVGLAIMRGCQHYRYGPEPVFINPPSRVAFSDEELAVALLSPCLPYNPRAVRVGAQMLGSWGNQPQRLALLARKERAEEVVRHVALAGQQTEPHEPFWPELLAALSSDSVPSRVIPAGVLPHPSRFRLEAGVTRPADLISRGGPKVIWLRPSSSPSVVLA